MYSDKINSKVIEISKKAESALLPVFTAIDKVSLTNTFKVMQAFNINKVSDTCFNGSTGYGYDDVGRETLDKIFADIFHTESALVRTGFVNGTHALSTGLFSMLGPGDILLSVTGEPYDTLLGSIGKDASEFGTLKYYGVDYAQVDLTLAGEPDYKKIKECASDSRVKAVFIQRSRGYKFRKALSISDIGKICDCVRAVNSNAYIMVDNCYGEFTEDKEPTDVGADIIAGSLIKNPGGGLAPSGGYIAGKEILVERAAKILTTPAIGGECGATLNTNRLLYQGLFLAPHTVAQALKTAVFCAYLLKELGVKTSPEWNESRSDIIQMIEFNDANKMKRFCAGIQAGAPVDSFVTPEPWKMPGYDCPVIMAAGSFIQGSSIELSADGPFTDPYVTYLQGGLTYESGKIGVMIAVSGIIEC